MAETLDPQAVALAKAIRQVESGGNFKARGKSGEFGAYQFTPQTWAKVAQKYGIATTIDKATPEQQNEAAYKQIKDWKDQGFNPGQIASMWNAGEGEPNAYTGKFSNGKEAMGVNKYGVQYNVPAYAKSVATAYQTLKQGGQVGIDPQNPSSIANTTPIQDARDTYGASFPLQASDNPLVAGLKTVGNIPSSAFNMAGNILSVAQHPIQTVKGVGQTLVGAGEKIGEKLLGKDIGQTDEKQSFDTLLKLFKDRYGSVDNAANTAVNDPVGFGSDVLALLEGGAALTGKVTGLKATEALNKGLLAVEKPVENTLRKAASIPAKALGATMGVQTGVGYEPIKEAFQASAQGGDAMKAFTEGLRGNISPDQLVEEARNAMGQVVGTRNQNYRTMLGKIGQDASTYDISPILQRLKTKLDDFNVKVTPSGQLDFSRSTIGEGADAAKIQQIYDDLSSWGLKPGDRTAAGLDTLKKRIGNYYSPSSDIRAFVSDVKNATTKVLEDAPGYTKAMKDYAELTDFIDETRKALSLGDNAALETTWKKLTSALKGNEARQQVLRELDEATGAHITQKIAGQRLSSLSPRGLVQYVEGTAALSALPHIGIVPILTLLTTTSPRLVGEFLRTLGLGTQKINQIMTMLNKVASPAVAAGRINQIVSSTSQQASPLGNLQTR